MPLETYYRIVIAVCTGVIGLCVGSFLNVVIYRLPLKMSLSSPPSHCTRCGYTLRWYDNIPVFSYLFLKGKCRKCKDPISPRYICVEILNAVLWLLCLWQYGFDGWRGPVCTVASAIACSVSICIAFIDIEHKIIFDRFQIIIGVLAVAFMLADRDVSILSHILGGVIAGGSFLVIGLVVSRSVGQEALGGGDIKFAFVSGLYLGIGRVFLLALMASVTASVFMLIRKYAAKGEDERECPFGPFLTAGFVISLLFGTQIIDLYLHLLKVE